MRFIVFTVRGGNNIVTLRPAWKFVIRVDSDSSLVRPTSPCRRTNSIVSLEGEDCSCAELQVSSCYRGWKKISGDELDLKKMDSRAGIRFFFLAGARRRRKFTPFWQKHEEKLHYRFPQSKSGWSGLNVVIFPPDLRLVQDDTKLWSPLALLMKLTS